MAIHLGAEVLGVKRGYAGLVSGDVVELDRRAVGGIMGHGGTFLGTSRYRPFYEEKTQREGKGTIDQLDIDGLVVIGGNGSLTGAMKLHHLGVPVVGVPATIDNDVNGTDIAVGVDTALNTILDAIDRIKDTASSHHRAFLIETMGRNSGYLALYSGLAGGAELILIPEIESSMEEIARTVRDSYRRGKAHCIIVAAEGWEPGAQAVVNRLKEQHGELGFEIRLTVLGHIQRGGKPSAFDRLLATRLGAAASRALIGGQYGMMAGWVESQLELSPLEEAVAFQKSIDLDLWRLGEIMER
jgi:6-phosphofructokinase 1